MMKLKFLLEILDSSEMSACIHVFHEAHSEVKPSKQYAGEEVLTPYIICFLLV